MDVEESLRLSKIHYKLFIIILKYIPIVALFGVYIEPLSNIAGMSLLTWIFLYVSTYVFRFCTYHRMFLWYILIDDLINIIDYYYKLPIETGNLLMLHNSIIGVFLFIILYLYVKSCKKSVIKDSRRYR